MGNSASILSRVQTDTSMAPTPTRAAEPIRAHYVRREDCTRGYVLGEPIQALCGKEWVPSRDPERYAMCETCETLMEMLTAAASS